MQQEINVQISDADAQRLLIMLQEAHYQAGINNESISRTVFAQAYGGSGNAMASCAAALLSTGDIHAPVTQVRELIRFMMEKPEQFVLHLTHILIRGGKIPGMGNSFFKDQIDPSFAPVNDFFRQIHLDNNLGLTCVDTYAQVANDAIASYRKSLKTQSENPSLFEEEKPALFPNAALITAGIVECLGGAENIENWFFITGRTRAWLEISGKLFAK